jgi:tubulin-specific chaperone B
VLTTYHALVAARFAHDGKFPMNQELISGIVYLTCQLHHVQVAEVKEKFRFHTGTPVNFQKLILRDNGRDICEIADDSKMLGYYSVESGMEIHIIDTDPFSLSRNGGLTDVSLVEKYRMDDEAYDKRKGTMREFFREQKKKNSGPKSANDSGIAEPPPGVESVEGISVGMRCEVAPGGRRGVVMFVGEIPNSPTGYWVSIDLIFLSATVINILNAGWSPLR